MAICQKIGQYGITQQPGACKLVQPTGFEKRPVCGIVHQDGKSQLPGSNDNDRQHKRYHVRKEPKHGQRQRNDAISMQDHQGTHPVRAFGERANFRRRKVAFPWSHEANLGPLGFARQIKRRVAAQPLRHATGFGIDFIALSGLNRASDA